MEGAVMQARTYRDIGYFDRNIAMLRDQFDRMMREARQRQWKRSGAASFQRKLESLCLQEVGFQLSLE